MGKTSYKNTEALIEEISKKLSKLNKGKLNLDEVNDLVENGKDLYEHLIILRYKAYDTYGDSSAAKEEVVVDEPVKKTVPEPVKEEKEEPIIDFSGISESSEVTAADEQPGFDFSIDGAVAEEPAVEEAVNNNEETVSDSPQAEVDDASNSLNDIFKSEDEQSLRKKLQNSPISDIKTHISIAKKFEYISNMFDGDSGAYNEAIEFLNTCATGNDARLKLNEYTTKYDWNLEDKSIIKFIELVERRYL